MSYNNLKVGQIWKFVWRGGVREDVVEILEVRDNRVIYKFVDDGRVNNDPVVVFKTLYPTLVSDAT